MLYYWRSRSVVRSNTYRLRRVQKAWLNKLKCSTGLPREGKCVIEVYYSEGWAFLPSFWRIRRVRSWQIGTDMRHPASGAVASHSVVVCVAACECSLRKYSTVSSDVMCASNSTNSKHQICMCVEEHNKVLVSWNILHELLHVYNFEKIPKLVRCQNGCIYRCVSYDSEYSSEKITRVLLHWKSRKKYHYEKLRKKSWFFGRTVEREPKICFFFSYNLRMERGTVFILTSLSAQCQ